MEELTRLCTIPGVDLITAWTLLAELGSDISVFQSPKHAASRAGLCPGNHESGGKQLSNRTRKGNRSVRRALCQSAWAASSRKNCYLAAFLLRDGTGYIEAGGDYFDRINPERTRARLVHRLQRLGLEVLLQPRTEFGSLKCACDYQETRAPAQMCPARNSV